MDVADLLIDKILSWVDLQKMCAGQLNQMATELEGHKKNVNRVQVAGSVGSVAGAGALTAVGAVAIATGGLVIPVLGSVGAVISGLSFATSLGSEVANLIISSCTVKEAKELEERIEHLEQGMQKLMESLKEEGRRREQQAGVSTGDYVLERILRAMAKRNGLEFEGGVNLLNVMSGLSNHMISGGDVALGILKTSALSLGLLSKFVVQAAAKGSGKALMSKLLPQLTSSMGAKAAAKALGRVGGGAVGLVVSVPELVINCVNLDKCETEASQRLRENAKVIGSASDELKKELDEIKKAFQKLARVKACVEKTRRSPDEKKTLVEFAVENCPDKTIRKWIREHSETETFVKLVDMFHLLKKKIDEEEKKNHSNNVNITFMAHGSIRDPMIPASCLLPLPSITDVVLHSPWNCVISADAAYGVATGKMTPQDRKFYIYRQNATNEKPETTKLPGYWNSLKETKGRMIPNIMLSPFQPEDRAWKRYQYLSEQYGPPGRNQIVIQYELNGKRSCDSSDVIPFSVVTLALSLVLLFSRFSATLHLTACLGDETKGQKLDKDYLKEQYACTADNTMMTYSEFDMFKIYISKYFFG